MEIGMAFKSKLEEKFNLGSEVKYVPSCYEEDLNVLYEPMIKKLEELEANSQDDNSPYELMLMRLEDSLQRAILLQKQLRQPNASIKYLKEATGEMLYTLHRHYDFVDAREEMCVIYPAEVVGLVCFLSLMSGIRSLSGIREYWIVNHPILYLLIPNMPHPKHLISIETVRTILKLLPPEEMQEMFGKYFSVLEHQEMPQELKEQMRQTIAFDGQEVRASYREGEYSRKKKGGIVVSAYSCEDKRVLGFDLCTTKGTEHQAISSLIPSLYVHDNAIFCADAINTRKAVIEVLNERNFEYLLPVKNNRKVLHDAMELAFQRAHQSEQLQYSSTKEQSGRIQTSTITIIPAPFLPDSDDFLHRVKTLVRYETTTQRVLKSNIAQAPQITTKTKDYICSLDFSQKSLEQIAHSIEVYWSIEVHHNTLDTVFMQDALNIKDENHLGARVGYNKMVYNVMSYYRQKLIAKGKKAPSFPSIVRSCNSPLTAIKLLSSFYATGAPENIVMPKSLPAAVKGEVNFID